MSYIDNYNYWLTNSYFDEETKKELKSISNNDKEIKERFYKNLEFGTGGLRGILGAGTNRVNIYTIRKATQGFSNYILNKEYKEKSVCIAYDSRNMSKELAIETALTFNGNGIKTYIFEDVRPTPLLSFAIRHLNCIGGIVITASHNPKEYNGYKVYGEDGAQISYPEDVKIIEYVNKIEDYKDIKTIKKDQAKEKCLYNVVGNEIDKEFIKNVMDISINLKDIKDEAKDLKIVYTPLHGAGYKLVKEVLLQGGFLNTYLVKEQELPDGNFPTLNYPNPEDDTSFSMAIELGKKIDANLLLATDPDVDRIGVFVKHKNNYEKLNGNMVGILLTYYILEQKAKNNTLKENSAIISSIVSTNLTKKIAESFNIRYFEVLTGFKYFGKLIKNFEEDKSYKYVFGFEESYGYLPGTYSRDKDAIGSALLICEMAMYYKLKNMDLIEVLHEIYKKYGYYKEYTKSINLEGIEGIKKIKKIMDYFCENYPKKINEESIIEFRNYNNSVVKNFKTNTEEQINLPKSNVLYFLYENDTFVCIRPSGTEPKLKIYFGVKDEDENIANFKMDNIKKYILDIVDEIKK